MKTCPICNRPANDRYENAAAGERCVHRMHDPYLTPAQLLYARLMRDENKRAATHRDGWKTGEITAA